MFNELITKLGSYHPGIVKVLVPRLLSVAIEPTNFCNLRCKMCYSQNPKIYASRTKGFMEWKLYKKIIDELSGLDRDIYLGLNHGGEALLHEEFVDMLKYASIKKKFHIGFTTNGTLLKSDVAVALIKNNVDSVTISLDGLKKQHESRRFGSRYDVVERNIMNLLEIRGTNPKPKIYVNMMVADQSQEDISDFVNCWKHVVDAVQVFPCLSENLQVNNPGSQINKYCSWPFSNMSILWNGDVVACCHDINGLNVLGNVATQNISQVWKGEAFTSLRQEALKNSFNPNSICSKCNAWKYSLGKIYEREI